MPSAIVLDLRQIAEPVPKTPILIQVRDSFEKLDCLQPHACLNCEAVAAPAVGRSVPALGTGGVLESEDLTISPDVQFIKA